VDVSALSLHLGDFYSHVNAAADGSEGEDSDYWYYYKAALQASNDRSNRILRGEIIEKIISQHVVAE
jgi:hypothetical protein